MRNDSDDSDLIRKICFGDHAAFTALVNRHSDLLFRLSVRYTGNTSAAEDIVQSSLLKLWQNPQSYSAARGSVKNWLTRITINASLDYLRALKPQIDITAPENDLDDPDIKDASQKLDEAALQIKIESAIAALPERQRTALELCFYNDFSNKDAANVMDINVKALESLLMRAKANLRASLNAEILQANSELAASTEAPETQDPDKMEKQYG